ncbi:MAG: AI-2E family transporter [Actinomycetia bacterium]|nr:AI-2E family transporter [Actinomycetes bacterium]
MADDENEPTPTEGSGNDDAGPGEVHNEEQPQTLLTGLQQRRHPPGHLEPESPRWSPQTKNIVAVSFAVVVLLVVYISRNVLAVAALAGLIAFLIAPAIRFLHFRLKVPRVLALLVTYFAVFIGISAMSFLVVDGIVGAVSEIDIDEAEQSLRSTAEDFLNDVREIKIAGYTIDLSETVDPLLEDLNQDGDKSSDSGSGSSDSGSSNDSGSSDNSGSGSDDSSKEEDSKRFALDSDQLQSLFGGLTSSVGALGSSLLAAFMSGVITVLVAIYLNADSTKFRNSLFRSLPDSYVGDAQRLGQRTLSIWRGYLYGQLLNSLIVGLLMWLVLWLVGLPGAFVFALILGVLNMIPTFGPILAAIPAVIAALALGSSKLDWSNLTFALLIVALYLIVVQLQSNLVAPFITGRAVKLSPATVIIGLLVGVQVGGLVGAVLVVPIIATGKEYGRYILAKLTDGDVFPPELYDEFTGGEPDPDGDDDSETADTSDMAADPEPAGN